ncbi:MAG: isoprenylcysteine carboxylmethyltransferase family protein [Gammaproteobacteria bacterium]|nr:isoprenylcysteine carboxylmethyltransferase family protein [Gammaproteobacteria bacterium]
MIRLGRFLFRFRNYLFPLALVLVVVPGPPVAATPGVAALVGLVLALLGQGIRIGTIGLEYIIRGGRERRVYAEKLVTDGVYAHSRNPMYVGNLLIVTGVCLTSNSWGCVALAVPLFVLAYLAITRAEEDFLAGRFGPAYARYCRDVPRFVPRLDGLYATFRASRFHWRRVLSKEYGTLVGWPLRWCFVLLWSLWRDGGTAALATVTPALGAVVAVLGTFYVSLRVLKKSRRLVAD